MPKFEDILRRLYWDEARLHLAIELHGGYEYRWLATWMDSDIPWLRSPPEPTTE